jgi:hypothetical protein
MCARNGPPTAEYLCHDETIRDPISVKTAVAIAKKPAAHLN